MTDSPIAAHAVQGNLPAFSVGELSLAIRQTLEGAFERVRVRGEVSGLKRHGSGHVYLCLKDSDAVIDAVIWRTTAQRLPLRAEDGMEVIATGRVTTYAGRSKYQLIVDSLELAGEGALLKLLEDRRRKLAAEGLFAAERKRPLPFLPAVVGIVTSPTGAVIRDILHRLSERFPRRVLLWPVAVQGEGAAEQVARAIAGFNALPPEGAVPRPDLLIVARGGGSLEDLWAFNEEVVVRAAAASAIPLISAVGHETDTTLIDFASDRRAPTPTAAAEMAVPVRTELLAQVLELARRTVAAGERVLDDRRVRLEGLARGLPDPRQLLLERARQLDDRAERLDLAARQFLRAKDDGLHRLAGRLPLPQRELDHARQHLSTLSERLVPECVRRPKDAASELASLGRLLETLSYKATLERGFAVLRDDEGVITSAADAKPGKSGKVQLRDGEVPVLFAGDKSVRRAAKPAKPAAAQRNLF